MADPKGYKLVIANKDYPVTDAGGDPALHTFVRQQRVGPTRPLRMTCATCLEFSDAWGWPQANGFSQTHPGHKVTLKMTPKGKKR